MSRRRVLLMGGALLVIAFVGVPAVARALFAPWSIGVLGRDTLTGDWVGTLRAQQGAEYGMYLHLEYKGRETSYRGSSGFGGSSNLKGRAILCAPTGERYEYEVLGDASRSGTIEDMWVEYGDPSLSALNLRLSGTWRGSRLSLRAVTNPFLPDGRFYPDRVLSSDDPDDGFAPFTLDRGDREDLDPICQRIRR